MSTKRPKVVYFGIAIEQTRLSPERVAVAEHLAQAGIDIEYVSYWENSHLDADLIIVDSAIPEALIPDDAKIFGQRTLNRRTRLDALAGYEGTVQPYGCPRSSTELDALLSGWGETQGVIKYDWSYRRVGVDLIYGVNGAPPVLPSDFDADADIIMMLHKGDPETIKVDAFAGFVLGSARLDTRQIGTRNWQLIGPRGHEPFQLDLKTKAMISKASAALVKYGVGYASFDLMFGPDGARVIEINSTNVGTLFWGKHPEPYARKYASAIAASLKNIDQIPAFGALREMAIKSNNAREAYAPEASSGPAQSVPDISAQLDIMIRQVEELSEEERKDLGSASFQAIVNHACEHVPAYAGCTQDALPIVTPERLRTEAMNFISRVIPAEHGTVHHAPIASNEHDGIAVACSHFSLIMETAIRRRVLRLAGVENAGELVSLLDAQSSAQHGLGFDSPASAVVTYLDSLESVSLVVRTSTAHEIVTEIERGACATSLRGLIIVDATLSSSQRKKFEDALGVPVAVVLYTSASGTVGSLCRNSDAFHLFSDVAEVTLDTTNHICLSTLFNYTMPILRYQTRFQVQSLVRDTGCRCAFADAVSFISEQCE